MGIFSRFLHRTRPVRRDADDGEELVREIHRARTDIHAQADQSVRMARVATSRSRDRVASGNFLADALDGLTDERRERRP